MNPEKMMDAISGISDKYIEKYAVVEPVKHDRLNRVVVRRKWVYRLCACLALLAIAVGIGIPVLNNNYPQHSFVLTAYALDDNNVVTAQDMTDSIQIPVSLFKTQDGLEGFLFSVDAANPDQVPSLAIYNANNSEQMAPGLSEIANAPLESGKHYFFFVGKEIEDFTKVSFFFSDEKTRTVYEVGIEVTESESGYFAELKKLNAFPTKTEE